jgi:hypothetical protein
VADLTDLIDRGLRGDKVIPPDQQSRSSHRQTDKAAEAKARDAVEREIDDVLGGTLVAPRTPSSCSASAT